MRKVLILKGLPGSGKSTIARQMMETALGNWKRINKDELRAMLDNNSWSGKNEDYVLNVRDFLILQALNSDKNVIIDDTNLHPKHQERIQKLVTEWNQGKNLQECAIVEVQFINTPIEECIRRDLQRTNSVGEKVIRKMYSQFLREKPVVVKHNLNSPDAIIVDMDGTLAIHNGRSPYDTAKCGDDLVNEPIAYIIKCVSPDTATRTRVLIVSGRDDTYYRHTIQWLSQNKIPYDEVHMRKAGDKRDDAVVKKEIYEGCIKGKYNVLFVLDDRPRVCRMWHQQGLTLLKVGDPDAEF